tara:strand:- start:596 stop:1171 length:576 start_codon:yes stop_codon:yes gene_type:complete
MNDTIDTGKELSLFQKVFLVFLSIILVISLFFFKNGFKANSMLDQLAKNSLLPDIAISNGRPTVFEFYADWCEACKEMAPDMFDIEKVNSNKVDVVLLNVDNPRWIDFVDKYDVNGIPKLIFFDSKGGFQGSSLGIKDYNELNEIFLALIDNSELPYLTKTSNSSKLILDPYSQKLNSNNIINSSEPRDHG